MRTTIRTLLAATLLGGFGANAQNTLIIEGTVAGCTPLQQVTVTSQPGTVPAFSWTFDLNPFTCGYDTIVEITSPSATVVVSTTCNGTTLMDGDTATFNFVNDTVLMVIDLACAGGGAPDCQGVPNGPDLPGTACDDGDPGTYNDLWTANCSCIGQPLPGCSADFTIQQLVVNGNPVPWTVTTTNLSTATPPVVYTWWHPDGTQALSFETQFTVGGPGNHWFSLVLVDSLSCTSSTTVGVMIDTTGMIFTGTPTWDCLGQFMGTALPGTPCDDNNPMSSNDLWDANCWCFGDTTGTTVDCMGITGGTALPGTACDDNNSWTTNDLWTGWCVCVGDSVFNTYDCLGILNGPNVTGSACDDNDSTTVNDTWSVWCTCSGVQTLDCQGVPNGPDVPGTACDDGDPGTYNDLWTANCSCIGQPLPGCSADFTIQQLVVNGNPVPWTVTTTNLSTATPPVVYTWWYPNGTSAQTFETQYTFGGAGNYWFSLVLVDSLGCASSTSLGVMIDTTGMIFTGTPTWDCLGQFMGTALPGTPCDDGNPMSSNDLWDANCWCFGDTTGTTVDCLGITGGTALPGTACDDNNSWTTNDLWTGWCVCVGDSVLNTYDCQGILNGPNMPGDTCESYFGSGVFGLWTATCTCDTMIWNTWDCEGILNGPSVPGSACDDGDPMTGNDTWDANCVCAGTAIGACQALFAIQQTNPWIISTTNLSTGVAPIAFSWWMPDGSTSTQFEPDHVFTSTGVYAICLSITDGGGCTSTACDTLFVDSLGFMYTGIPLIDCFGVPWGPALSGTACDDGDPNTINDTWNVNCACVGYAGNVDCLGITNGPNMPGTACTDSMNNWSYSGIWGNNCLCTPISWMDCNGVQNGPDVPGNWCDDGDPNTVGDVWDANCNCAGQGGGWVDCLGIPNGTAMPGTPCDDGDPNTFNDTWNGNCSCVGSGGLPCEADFIVTQAYDSLQGPIPGTIWVFFLNNGGQGFTYSWDFGDGTTSNVPFPTHTYAGNGPYQLCLTIDDGMGCIDTYCDSVGVNANGIILPMGAQSQGFTINVMGGANSIPEAEVLSEVAIAPNPVNDVLTLSLNSTRSGALLVDVLDVTGKLIHQQRASLATGANTLRLDLSHLEAGPYLLRLNADGTTRTERFVRGY